MKEITKEQEERLSLYAIYTILYMNDMACFSIEQIGKDIDKANKECNKIYCALLKREKAYCKSINNVVGDKMDYYCDYCTEMDNICDDTYFEYKKAISKTYQDAGIQDYNYFATIETMRSIIELSVITGKDVINKVSKYIPDAKWLECYLLKDISRVANNLADWEYRKVDKSISIIFDEESEVIKKFRELSEKLIDYDSFYKSYEKSLELDKERKNKQE